jgi:hypothetical protein
MLTKPLTTKQLRELTGYSSAALVDLEQRGIIARSSKNSWPMPETITRIITHLRERSSQRKSAADDALRQARAHEIEIRTAERLRHLLPVEDVRDTIDAQSGLTRTVFSGLPARCTRDLSWRRLIEDKVNDCFAELSESFGRIGRALQAGSDLETALAAEPRRKKGGTK